MYSFNWGNPFQAAAGLVPSARGTGAHSQTPLMQQPQAAILGSANLAGNQHGSNMALYGMTPAGYVNPGANTAWMPTGMGYGSGHHSQMPMTNMMHIMHPHQAHQPHFMPSAMQNPLIGAHPSSNMPRGPRDSVAQQSVKDVRDVNQMKNEPQKWSPVPVKSAGPDEQLKQQRPVNPANPASNLGQAGLQVNLAAPPPPPPPSSPTRPEAPAEATRSLQDKPPMNAETRPESDQFSSDAPILSDEEFEMQLGAWNRQFENWREQNQNHPDRDAYRRYERQWQSWREQLMARREQMRQLSNIFPNKLGPGPCKDVAAAEGSNEYRNLSKINERAILNTSEQVQPMKNAEEPTQIGQRNTGLGQVDTTSAHHGKPPAIEGARGGPRPLMEITPVIPPGRFPRQSEPPLQQQSQQQQPQSQSRTEMCSESEGFVGRPGDAEQESYEKYVEEESTETFKDQFDQRMKLLQRPFFDEGYQFDRDEPSQDNFLDRLGHSRGGPPRGGQRGGQRGLMMGLQGAIRGRQEFGGPRPLMESLNPPDRLSFEGDEDSWGGVSNESLRAMNSPLFNARLQRRGVGFGQAGRQLRGGYDNLGVNEQLPFNEGDRGGPQFNRLGNRPGLLHQFPNRNIGFMGREQGDVEDNFDAYEDQSQDKDSADDNYLHQSNIPDTESQQEDLDDTENVDFQRGVGLGVQGLMRGRGRGERGFSRGGPREQGLQRGRGRGEQSFPRGGVFQESRGRGEHLLQRGRGRGEQGFSRLGGLEEEMFQGGRGRGEQVFLRGRGRGEQGFSRGAGLLGDPGFLRGRGRREPCLLNDIGPWEQPIGSLIDDDDDQEEVDDLDTTHPDIRGFGRGRGTGELISLMGRGRGEQRFPRGGGIAFEDALSRGRGRGKQGIPRGGGLGGDESYQRGRGHGEQSLLRGRGRGLMRGDDPWEQRFGRFAEDDEILVPAGARLGERGFNRGGSDEDEDDLLAARFGNRRFGEGDGDQSDAFLSRFGGRVLGRGRGGIGLLGLQKAEGDNELDNAFVARFGGRGFGRGRGMAGHLGFGESEVDDDQDSPIAARLGDRGFGRGRGIGQQILRRDEQLGELGFGRNLISGDASFGRGRGGGLGERGFGRGRGGASANFAFGRDEGSEDEDIENEPGTEMQRMLIGRGRGEQSLLIRRGRGEQSLQMGRGRGELSLQIGRGRGELSLQMGRGRGEQVQMGRGRGELSVQTGRGRGEQVQTGRGRGEQVQTGRGRGEQVQTGRGRGEQVQTGRGRGDQVQTGRGRGGEQSHQMGRGRGEQSVPRARGAMKQDVRGGHAGRQLDVQGQATNTNIQDMQFADDDPIDSDIRINQQHQPIAQLQSKPNFPGLVLQADQKERRPSLLGDPNKSETVCNAEKDVRSIQQKNQTNQQSQQSVPTRQPLLKTPESEKQDQQRQTADQSKSQGVTDSANKSMPPSSSTAKLTAPVKPFETSTTSTQVVEPAKPAPAEKDQQKQDRAGTASSAMQTAPGSGKDSANAAKDKGTSHAEKAVDNIPKEKEGTQAPTPSVEPSAQDKVETSPATHGQDQPDATSKPRQRVSRFTPADPAATDNSTATSVQASQQKPSTSQNADDEDDIEILFVTPPVVPKPGQGQQQPSRQGERGGDARSNKDGRDAGESNRGGRSLSSSRGDQTSQRSRNENEDLRGDKRGSDDRGSRRDRGSSRNRSRDVKGRGQRGDPDREPTSRGRDSERHSGGDFNQSRGGDRYNQRSRDRSNSRSRSRTSPPSNRYSTEHDGDRSSQRGKQMDEGRFFRRDDIHYGKEEEDTLRGYLPFVPDVTLPAERRRGQNLKDVSNYTVYGDMDNTYRMEEPGSGPPRDFQIKRERLDADVLASVDMRLLAMATGQQIDLRPDLSFEQPAAKVPRFEQQSGVRPRMIDNLEDEAPLVAVGGTISRALTEKEQEIIVATAENLKALQEQKKVADLVSALFASNPQPLSIAAANINSAEWPAFGRTSETQRQELNVQDTEAHLPDHWPKTNVFPGSDTANPHGRELYQGRGNFGDPQEDSRFYEDRFDEDCDPTRNFETENKPFYSRRGAEEDVPARDRPFQHRFSDMDAGTYTWGESEDYQDEGWERDEQYAQEWAPPWRDEMNVAGGSMEAPVSIDYGHKSADIIRNTFERDNLYAVSGEEEDYGMRESSFRANRPEPQFIQRREIEDRYKDTSRDTVRDLGRNLPNDSDKNSDLGRVSSRKVSESDRRDQGRDSSWDRSHSTDRHHSWEGHSQDRDRHRDHRERSTSKSEESKGKHETVLIEDLIGSESRRKRPSRIVLILRGPPGSGKTYVAKLIKDKEIERGGGASAIRMLCLDDYFSIEVEQTSANQPDYKYDPIMVDRYRNSLYKTFRKTVDDGFFPFIIVDAIHNKVRHFDKIWSYAKQKGFQVYIAEMDTDAVTCHKRNIHNRSLEEIKTILKSWEPAPAHYSRVDIRSLLQDAAIPEVEMEDTVVEGEKNKQVEEKEDVTEKADSSEIGTSRWEKMEATEEKLAKLDGLRSMKKRDGPKSIEDYLQLPDDYELRQADLTPGKKRVRWADVEERKHQERKRALGFVVGQTDWDSLTDPNHADKALTKTKYI